MSLLNSPASERNSPPSSVTVSALIQLLQVQVRVQVRVQVQVQVVQVQHLA
jgi:hypothetical protein